MGPRCYRRHTRLLSGEVRVQIPVAPPRCDSSVAELLARIQQTGVRFSVAAPCDRTQTVRGLSVEQVLMSSTLIGHSKYEVPGVGCPVSITTGTPSSNTRHLTPAFGPVAQRTSAAPSEGAGHRFKSDQGLQPA